MDFIEPCFGIGHNLSLICQMTSEDIKHQLIIIISLAPVSVVVMVCRGHGLSWSRSVVDMVCRGHGLSWSWSVSVMVCLGHGLSWSWSVVVMLCCGHALSRSCSVVVMLCCGHALLWSCSVVVMVSRVFVKHWFPQTCQSLPLSSVDYVKHRQSKSNLTTAVFIKPSLCLGQAYVFVKNCHTVS